MTRLMPCALALFVALGAGEPAPAPAAADYNAQGAEDYAAGDWARAVESFRKARELAPDNPTIRRNLCNALQASADELARKADFASASELLEEAIAADPKSASPLVQLGSYYLRLDMVQDAVFRLKEALELDPNQVDARELIGDAYYRSNDLTAALDAWEKVYTDHPDRPGLREKLEKAYREGAVEAKFGRSGSRHFRISYAPGTTREEQTRLLSMLERAFLDIGQKFGGVYPPGPVNVIVYTADDFAAATQLGDYVGAVYDGKIRVPLKDKAGHTLPDDELRRRLYHEYVHVVVRFLLNDNAPWWLNEGLAETFSRDGGPDLEALKAAARENRLFPLSQLDGDLLASLDAERLHVAYLQAYATVNLLWSRFSANHLTSFLTSLAEGTDPETALQQYYRRNYALLEREVLAQTK